MNKNGFTLLEISIVLVIIAMITGAVVAGRALVRGSEIRSAMGEFQRYQQALGEFRDKYMAMPGDFSGATALWGAAHATPATCRTTQGTPPATCDGDGDGKIASGQNSTYYYEEFRAWEHLTNAKLISDITVTGMTGSAGSHDRVPGSNIPASKLNGAGWGLTHLSVYNLTTGAMTDIPYVSGDIPPNHVLWLGGRSTNSTNVQDPALTVEEAADIDAKMDDGLSNTGKVVAQTNAAAPLCVSSSAYDFTQTDIVCSLVFKTGF